MKHTPEPWYQESDGGGSIIAADPQCVEVIGSTDGKKWQENARRIVACVNACAGMADPAKEIAKLKAERDELLAAMEEISCFENGSGFSGDKADEILAKIKVVS